MHDGDGVRRAWIRGGRGLRRLGRVVVRSAIRRGLLPVLGLDPGDDEADEVAPVREVSPAELVRSSLHQNAPSQVWVAAIVDSADLGGEALVAEKTLVAKGALESG